MKNGGAYLHEGLRQLGVPGVVGLALFAFSLSFYFSAVLPARQELKLIAQAQVQKAAPASESNTRMEQTPKSQLARFYRLLPQPSDVPRILRLLNASAVKHGLILERADYAPETAKDDGLIRYRITVPVKGLYPQLRAFLRDAMTKNRTLSLDSIEIQKERVGDTVVEAKLAFTLYLRETAP